MKRFTWYWFVQIMFQVFCFKADGFKAYEAAILFIMISILFTPYRKQP